MASDEFSSGVRSKKRNIAVRRRKPPASWADTKPEALVAYQGEDDRLVETLDRHRRSIETLSGARGNREDHAVTYRAMDAVKVALQQEILQGALDLNDTTTTAGNAEATADQALIDANEAHTGEVTSAAGSRNLSVHESAISNQALVDAASGDQVVILDATDGTLKKADVDTIVDGGYF